MSASVGMSPDQGDHHVQRDNVRRSLAPNFTSLDDVLRHHGEPACSIEPEVDQGGQQQFMVPERPAGPARKRKHKGKGKRKHKKKSKTMASTDVPDELVDEDAQLAHQDAVQQEQHEQQGHRRPADSDHSSDSEDAEDFANAADGFSVGSPAATVSTPHNSPVNGFS